jgi:hypothetical protein
MRGYRRAMIQGLYRFAPGWAHVRFGNGAELDIARDQYELEGYEPPFEDLPLLVQPENEMPKGPHGERRPTDVNQLAKRIADIVTGEVEGDAPDSPMAERGRGGGLKGGKARAQALTPEQRSEIARKAAAKRWGR